MQTSSLGLVLVLPRDQGKSGLYRLFGSSPKPEGLTFTIEAVQFCSQPGREQSKQQSSVGGINSVLTSAVTVMQAELWQGGCSLGALLL